ncbi:MAG TPA: glutaredoxin family protein [Methylotenera sp.]|nr:glutaredoxin family protein [Methylotenera sp.]
MTIHLNLYSTSHCHLCEQAEALLISLSKQYDIQWVSIEIAEDAALLKSYEIRIPVLKNLDTNIELAWPFTLENIEESFLS